MESNIHSQADFAVNNEKFNIQLFLRPPHQLLPLKTNLVSIKTPSSSSSEMFPFEQFDVSKVSDNDSLNIFERVEGDVATQTQVSVLEDFGMIWGNDLFFSSLGPCQNKLVEECKAQLISDFRGSDYLDVLAQPSQSWTENITKNSRFESLSEAIEPDKEIPSSVNFPSYRILKEVTGKSRLMNGRRINVPSYDRTSIKVDDPKSTTAILSLAGENFIQLLSEKVDDPSLSSNPYAFSFIVLSDEVSRDVELVQDLLACAEKVGQQQFDCASKLITQCEKLSSNIGRPVRRLTYYFSAALREKINKDTCGIKYNGTGKAQILDLRNEEICSNPSMIAFHQKIPFSQVCQFTAIQTIAENVRGARYVHIIDIEIRSGMQHIVLMQALAAQSQNLLPRLKITAIAIGTRSKAKIEETGKHLMSFAQSMNLVFSLNVLMIEDLLDLSIDLFQLDNEEKVAVYSAYTLTTLISHPDHLDCLMRVMRNINPCVLVMYDVEANHNSPAFVNRFIEALFYYGAFFDAVADCMADEESNRRILEADFGLMINNIIAAEGEERIVRHVNHDVWRTYFTRFGLVETDLSSVSEYQADLLVKNFKCGNSCTLDMDDKCLVVGWKGDPLFSLSTWKFL